MENYSQNQVIDNNKINKIEIRKEGKEESIKMIKQRNKKKKIINSKDYKSHLLHQQVMMINNK